MRERERADFDLVGEVAREGVSMRGERSLE